MHHVHMTQRKPPPKKPQEAQQSPSPDSAFDVWLNRGLHQLFDDVTKEPVPDALMKLIQDDKNK